MLKLVKRPGSPFWVARGTIDDRRVERSTGCRDKGDAKRALPAIIAACTRTEVDPAQGLRFDQAAALYLSQKPGARFLAPLIRHFGTVPVAQINAAAMRAAGNMLYPNVKPATLRRQLYTPVKAIMNAAAAEDLCSAPRFKAPKGGASRTVFITPIEANAIISALTADPNPALAPLVTLLFGQGSRMGETLALRSSDLSLEGRYALLRDTKNGSERRVSLIPRVAAALSVLPRKPGAVFLRSDGKPFRDSSLCGGQIRSAFARAVRAAGLDPEIVTPHVCRHSWATWFYAQTLDPLRMKAEGGWKSNEWQRYTHLATPELGRLALEAGWDFRGVLGEERGKQWLSA